MGAKDTDGLAEISNDEAEQVRLLRLASDVWSRITDETSEPSRSDSRSSSRIDSKSTTWSSSFESPVADSDVVQTTDDATRANDLFGDALRAILRGEVTRSSATDGHDDAAGRAKAVLVRALRRIGEVDSREAADATTTRAPQRQPTLGQSPLPTPRVEPVAHSPRVVCLQDQFVPRTVQPSGASCAAMGSSPRISLQPPPVTPVLSRRALAPQVGRMTSGGYTIFQPGAPQDGAMAVAAATSAAVAAAMSSAAAAALLGTPLGLTKCASCHTITTTTTSTIITNAPRIAATRTAAYAELRPRIR